MLGELSATLFENHSNHVGWRFPYLNTSYKLKLFVNILRGKKKRKEKKVGILWDALTQKSENENQNWKKQFDFHSKAKNQGKEAL